MRCANATELYLAMWDDIDKGNRRIAGDGAQTNETWEALPGRSHTLCNPGHNLVACRKIDYRWAAASTLHFFTGSEEASTLVEFNGAERFLTFAKRYPVDGVCDECGCIEAGHTTEVLWEGAYGAHAMPQIHRCIEKLRKEPSSRRAIITMANLDIEDINRPHCWTSLHFLAGRDGLDLIVYQRSLNLAIMPYDLVNLTNILNFVATAVKIPPANLRWLFGSLHCLPNAEPDQEPRQRNESLLFDYSLLSDPAATLLNKSHRFLE